MNSGMNLLLYVFNQNLTIYGIETYANFQMKVIGKDDHFTF